MYCELSRGRVEALSLKGAGRASYREEETSAGVVARGRNTSVLKMRRSPFAVTTTRSTTHQ